MIFRQLVEEALFLRQYGERPPGAPRDDPKAETWGDWCKRAEGALRAAPAATSDTEPVAAHRPIGPDTTAPAPG